MSPLSEHLSHADPSSSLEIPFLNPQHAFIAKTALQVDREQNATFVTRNLSVEDNVLVVYVQAGVQSQS